jgi:hypothetical protein
MKRTPGPASGHIDRAPYIVLVVALAASLAVAGCGSGQQGEAEDWSGRTRLALATCDASKITWSDPNSTTSPCAGPFEYYPACYKASPRATAPNGGDSACGIDAYVQTTCNNTCRNPAFGYDTSVFDTTPYSRSHVCTRFQTCEWDAESHRYFCWWDWDCGATPSCYAEAQAIVAGFDPNMPRPYVSFTYTSTPNPFPDPGLPSTPAQVTENCAIQITTPKPAVGTGSVCGTHACDDPNQPIYKSCRLPPHGEAPASECGTAAQYSVPNLSGAGLASAGLGAISTMPAPVCVTGEADQTSTPTQVQAKHDHLVARYNALPAMPAGVDQAALKAQLIRNLKALYELFGGQLTRTQQDFTLGLYLSNPTIKHDCSGWPAPAVTTACGDVTAVNGAFDMCARLQAVGAFPDVLASRTDQCVAAATQVAALNANCPVQQYRDGYDSFLFDLIASTQQQLQADASARLNVPDVQAHLGRIGTWYAKYRTIYPASAGDPANQKVWASTSRVLGSFWQAVHAKTGLPPPGTQFAPSSVPDTFFQSGLEADRTVLISALTAPAGSTQLPITTAPLVELLGDGLQSVSARLAQVGLNHDLACRFRIDNPSAGQVACKSGQVKTEISELVRLLSAAADPGGELSSLLASKPSFGTPSWGNWTGSSPPSPFDALSKQSAAFAAAVLDALSGVATYTPDLIAPNPPPAVLPLGGLPPPPPTVLTTPVLGFAKVVQDARLRINSYQQTGLFDSRFQGVLRAGIQQDRVNDVISRVQARTSDLNTQVTNYKADRTSLANKTLQGMTNLATQQSITDQVKQRLAQEQQLSQDVAGLRQSIEVTEARYGDFMRAYNSLTTLNVDPGTTIQHTTTTVAVGAADARWQAPAAPQLLGDALTRFVTRTPTDTPWKVPALKGDILNINITGSWSPTCALHTTQFINPFTNAPGTITVPAGAPTGPEGYLVTLSQNTYSASSNSSVHQNESYSNSATTTSFCGGASAGFSFRVPIIGISLGASAQASYCRSHDFGTRVGDSTTAGLSSGSESRMSAAFTTGVRLPNTPFPLFPAGSLLLLEVKKDIRQPSRNDVVDVHVLQAPYSSIPIGADSDVYLVVNDIVDPSCGTADSRQLALTINQLRPFGSLAVSLGNGMAKALSDLHAQQSLLIEQGRVGPQQMQLLRDQAFQDLADANCKPPNSPPCPLAGYPAEVLKFFETWVDKELATVERKVDVKSLERQIVLLDLQHQALSDDLTNAQDQARLLRLLPDWTLKDLDTQLLQSNTQALLQLMIADLYPIVDLKQPGTLPLLDAPTLNQLLGNPPTTDWTGGLDAWTTATINASNNIVARLRDSLANSPPQNDLIVALGFPNPVNPPQAGQWQRVTPERASALWSAIAAKQPFATISVEPTDLFDIVRGASNVLFCNDSVPVITAMAVYMVRPGLTDAFPGRFVPMAIDNNLNFPDTAQLKNYRLDNADWLSQQIAVLAGEAEDSLGGSVGLQTRFAALTADSATPLYRVGNGLSPFTRFDVHLDGITTSPFGGPAPADSATELVLAFRVLARNVAGIHLAPMCP